MTSIPCTAGAVGLCCCHHSAAILICCAPAQGGQAGAYPNPSSGAREQGQLLAAILGEWSTPARLSGHLYFPAARPLEMCMAPIIAELLMATPERVEQL